MSDPEGFDPYRTPDLGLAVLLSGCLWLLALLAIALTALALGIVSFTHGELGLGLVAFLLVWLLAYVVSRGPG